MYGSYYSLLRNQPGPLSQEGEVRNAGKGGCMNVNKHSPWEEVYKEGEEDRGKGGANLSR